MAEVRRALVLAASPDVLTVVGGVPLAVRAVLALAGAGVDGIALLAGPQAAGLQRELGRRRVAASVAWVAEPEDAARFAGEDPVLVLAGDVLFDAAALAPLVAAGLAAGSVIRGVGRAPGVRVAVCPASRLAALVAELAGGRRSLAEALARIGGLDGPAVDVGEGLWVPLDATHPPAVLEARLLDALGRRTAARDGYLASLVGRRLSRPVTRRLLATPVTPSQVTVAGAVVGLAGAAGLGTGAYAGQVAGALALVGSAVLDSVDGELARARFEQSAAGARLDVVSDRVTNVAAVLGLGIGLVRHGLAPGGEWVALAGVAGVAAVMATTRAVLVQPAPRGAGEDLRAAGDGKGLRGTALPAVSKTLASRDYTYVLLAAAVAGRLEWFLYAAAAGAWLLVAGLLACSGRARLAARRAPALP